MNSTDEGFVRERVSCIMRSAEKAAELSQQMLAYTGKQQVVSRPTSLNDLVERLLPIFLPGTNLEAKLQLELSSEIAFSKTDSAQIERVLLNLVSNAKSACQPNDKITIRTGHENVVESDASGDLFGRRVRDGEFAYLEVEDTGRGISKSNMQRMFEPFFTDTPGGKGLGLSVVFGIVDGHNGFIRCRSEIDQGTCIRIYLPRCRPIVNEPHFTQAPKIESKHGNQQQAKRAHVLIVDEESNASFICERLLREDGWETTVMTDPQAALKLLTSDGQDMFDCVLLNDVMPKMGGHEFVSLIERAELDVPIVLMSGFRTAKLKQYKGRRNVSAVVKKPFHSDDVQKVVLAAIKQRLKSDLFSSN